MADSDQSAMRMDCLRSGYRYAMKCRNWSEAQRLGSLMAIEAGFSIESAYALADAFYMGNKLDRAIDTLAPFMTLAGEGSPVRSSSRADESCVSTEAIYLYALCCFGKERYSDVVSVLYPIGLGLLGPTECSSSSE